MPYPSPGGGASLPIQSDDVIYTSQSITVTEALDNLNQSTIGGTDNVNGFNATLQTTNRTWTTIYSFPVPNGSQGDFVYVVRSTRNGGIGRFRRSRDGVFIDDSGTILEDADTISSPGINAFGLGVRDIVSGGEILIQVRGRIGQTWDWEISGVWRAE